MFPPEILDNIVSHVAPEDVTTLNACAATHPQMVAASRAQSLNIPALELKKFGRVQSLFQLMASPRNSFNLQLAIYLKTLTLGEKNNRSPHIYKDLGELTSEIFVLQNLEDLTIDSFLWNFNTPNPAHVPQYPTRLPELTYLNLSHIHFDSLSDIVNFICACPKLETLKLWGVTWPASNSNIPVNRAIPTSLKMIEFMTMNESKLDAVCPQAQPALVHYGPLLDWMLACHAEVYPEREGGEVINTPNPNAVFPAIERIWFRFVHNCAADSVDKLLIALKNSLKDISVTFLPGHYEADNKLWNHPTMKDVQTLYIARLSGVAYYK